MTENYRFFDTASYSEAAFAEVMARLSRTGVCQDVGSTLLVSAGGGSSVNVATGEAFVEGFWYQNTATLNLAVAANASATVRIDWVVLKLDRTANTVTAQIHQGIVGSGVPSLTQVAGGTWELPLAQLSTASSVTTITDARAWSKITLNPMTTSQDIIIADAAGNPTRLAKGPAGTVLTTNRSGVVVYDYWQACRVQHSVNQSIAHAVSTTLAFDTESYDVNGMHSTVTNNSRINILEVGNYLIHGTIYWSTVNATGERWLWAAINGGVVTPDQMVVGAAGGASRQIVQVISTYTMNAGDYVELVAFQSNSGLGALPVAGGLQYSPVFTVSKLR